MTTNMKQIRFNNRRDSFPTSRRFHSMTVRGIGVMADVSGGLFGGKARADAAVVAGLSNRPTVPGMPAAA